MVSSSSSYTETSSTQLGLGFSHPKSPWKEGPWKGIVRDNNMKYGYVYTNNA